MIKNSPANTGDMCLIPGAGRSPGEGNGNSSVLSLEILCIEVSGRLQSMG